MERNYDPNGISVPDGYKVELMHKNLNVPISLVLLENGEMVYGDSGIQDGNGKLIKITNTGHKVIADQFEPPLTGVTYYKGDFYVSHKGTVTRVNKEGKKTDLLVGLPSYGDHHNNRVTFGSDGKMYFGQGTATNSGVVGLDNSWVRSHPYFRDYPAKPIKVTGKSFETLSFIENKPEVVRTGPFSAFGTQTEDKELIKSILAGAGTILKADADGSNLELVAWGFRNPFVVKFDQNNQLWVGNHGMDVRGSRPVKNSPDEFIKVKSGEWYGWPDYTGGYPITLPFFKPEQGKQPEFIMTEHPSVPKRPFVNFIPHSAITGFDFNYHQDFGFYGDCFISEFGPEDPTTTGGTLIPSVGHKVTRIDMNSGQLFYFAHNKSGLPASESDGRGLERPVDIVFGNDHHMYILDFGVMNHGNHRESNQKTGAIWKVSKN